MNESGLLWLSFLAYGAAGLGYVLSWRRPAGWLRWGTTALLVLGFLLVTGLIANRWGEAGRLPLIGGLGGWRRGPGRLPERMPHLLTLLQIALGRKSSQISHPADIVGALGNANGATGIQQIKGM